MFKVQNEDLVGENSSEMLYIPRPNVVWDQPKFGDVPDFIGPNYNHCLLIKLAQGHAAIDYLILDYTPLGVAGFNLYFVQVSVQTYQSHERKYSAIDKKTCQLKDQTFNVSPRTHYLKALHISSTPAISCKYLYASSAKSNFGVDHTKVYEVMI